MIVLLWIWWEYCIWYFWQSIQLLFTAVTCIWLKYCQYEVVMFRIPYWLKKKVSTLFMKNVTCFYISTKYFIKQFTPGPTDLHATQEHIYAICISHVHANVTCLSWMIHVMNCVGFSFKWFGGGGCLGTTPIIFWTKAN